MPVHAPVTLPVKWVAVDLGDRVTAGQLLVELDGGALPTEIKQAQHGLAASEREIQALQDQQHSRRAVLTLNQGSANAERRRLEAELAIASTQFTVAQAAWERAQRLGAGGNLSTEALEKRQAEVSEANSRKMAVRAALSRQEADRGQFAQEQQVALATIEQTMADREADMSALIGRLETLQTALQRTRITAPTAGTIGAIADLGTGAVVENAAWLLTLVPDTAFEIEAHFETRALGQLQLGQTGRLRLDSFPWASYGLVAAKLSRLGVETGQGFTLARFEIEADANQVIPLRNGLVGHLEVEVRRVPPAVLLLEVVGRMGFNSA
jgi:multidrug resistance efflux pump